MLMEKLTASFIEEAGGKMFEAAIFGRVVEESAYTMYAEAIRPRVWSAIKAAQPWPSPIEPAVRFASDLQYEVAELLGSDEVDQLEFHTLVGSKWDHHIGDAILVWRGYFVTLDVTKNPEKLNGKKDTKSDFLVSPADVEFDRLRQELAAKIANKFLAGEARMLSSLWSRQEAAAQQRRPRRIPRLRIGA